MVPRPIVTIITSVDGELSVQRDGIIRLPTVHPHFRSAENEALDFSFLCLSFEQPNYCYIGAICKCALSSCNMSPMHGNEIYCTCQVSGCSLLAMWSRSILDSVSNG